MPIGDLLAQISGEKSNPGPDPSPRGTNPLPAKRKPDDDLRSRLGLKAPRTNQGLRPGGLENQAAPHVPYTGNARPSSNVVAGRASASAPRSGRLGQQREPSHRPGAPAAPSAAPTGPPKKGSFAEILARGQRAQAVMGQVGKIQHKKVEKGAAKKTQGDAVAPTASSSKARAVSGYAGTAKPPAQRDGPNGSHGHKPLTKDSPRKPSNVRTVAVGRRKAKEAEESEAAKKVKKAAQATTGYTGTARPKPGNPARKKDAPRGGALLNAPRPKVSKRSRYEDDYDEDLDEFIEYDEDDDDDDDERIRRGPRYDYASDGSSDMEAGMGELDDEERRAEFIGRREDEAEERLERSLKTAKEERKRKALADLRARRR
ncbi:uncharacterized protein UV8b_06606 [Ustilaginoidea virens]|uniref:Chromatin SPT2 n=2 Tax=Ustilaginoidea virens TaxID=1159556 RepID=A0A8E5HVX1_USTVR|nr:uncharacterized protein UV8b_06606 [Ustilaginoidea virens]QUC22365.1 hypothetical protein UV8b_06606 [Ustilaginoidea virens]